MRTSEKRIRLGSFLLSVMVLASLIIPLTPSTAAVTEGNTCKKAKQVRVVKGVSLRCVKADKKLVWRKISSAPVTSPAVDVNPSPSPSPSPTIAPSPSASPIPKPISTVPAFGRSGGYVYRYDSGKQERLNFDGDWYATDARNEEAFHPIRVAAYKSITSLPIDEDHKNIKFEYTIKPSYPKAIADVIKKQSTDTARRLSPLLDRRLTIRMILITEQDQEFITRELPSIIPFEPNSLLSFMKNFYSLDSFRSVGGTGGGQAGYIEARDYGFYLAHTSSLAELDTYWPEVPPHELAHVLQFFLARNHNSQFGEGHPEGKFHGHLVEGSANTLGMALAFETLGWYSDEMDRILKRNVMNSRFQAAIPMKTVDDAVELIKVSEKRNTEIGNEFSYSAGQIVWEYFIGKHGVGKFIEFLRNIPKTRNFNENLKTTIGMDKDAFYREAGQYLLDTWIRLSKI